MFMELDTPRIIGLRESSVNAGSQFVITSVIFLVCYLVPSESELRAHFAPVRFSRDVSGDVREFRQLLQEASHAFYEVAGDLSVGRRVTGRRRGVAEACADRVVDEEDVVVVHLRIESFL